MTACPDDDVQDGHAADGPGRQEDLDIGTRFFKERSPEKTL